VAGGHNTGLDVLLVLTGVSEGRTEFDSHPDYIAEGFTW
jgi:ribonucleotide monophosphatase NagD (HAD superfamily)